MDRGAWQATGHGGRKEPDRTERLNPSSQQVVARRQGGTPGGRLCCGGAASTPEPVSGRLANGHRLEPILTGS